MHRHNDVLFPPSQVIGKAHRARHREAVDFLDDLQDIATGWSDNPTSHRERRSAAVLLSMARRRMRRRNIAGVLRMARVFA